MGGVEVDAIGDEAALLCAVIVVIGRKQLVVEKMI
jgi:hypothetical protein